MDLLLYLIILYGTNHAVSQSTEEATLVHGTEFFLAFPLHAVDKAEILQLLVVLSNLQNHPVDVTVSFPKLDLLQSLELTLPPRRMLSQELNASVELQDSCTQGKGIYVNSSDPIEVQVTSSSTGGGVVSRGGYLVLPHSALGTEYLTATHCTRMNCFLAIVVTEIDTHVTVHLRIPATDTAVFDGVSYTNDEVISVRGDVGDVMQILCWVCDMSGTYVNATKPVAVLSGGQFTTSGSNCTGRDLVVEQIPPVTFLGQMYVLSTDLVPTLASACYQVIKVITHSAGTQFTFQAETYISSVTRETFVFEIMGNDIVTITASEKILVAQIVDPDYTKDACMFVPLPVNNWATTYQISVSGLEAQRNHLILVVEGDTAVKIATTGNLTTKQTVQTAKQGNFSVIYTALSTGENGHVILQCEDETDTCRPFYGFLVQGIRSSAWSVSILPFAPEEDLHYDTLSSETTAVSTSGTETTAVSTSGTETTAVFTSGTGTTVTTSGTETTAAFTSRTGTTASTSGFETTAVSTSGTETTAVFTSRTGTTAVSISEIETTDVSTAVVPNPNMVSELTNAVSMSGTEAASVTTSGVDTSDVTTGSREPAESTTEMESLITYASIHTDADLQNEEAFSPVTATDAESPVEITPEVASVTDQVETSTATTMMETEASHSDETTVMVSPAKYTSAVYPDKTTLAKSHIETTAGGLNTADVTDSSQFVQTTYMPNPRKKPGQCACSCAQKRDRSAGFGLSGSSDQTQLQAAIRTELELDSRTLSMTRRKKTSAQDVRPTSVSIGVTAVAVISCVFGAIVCCDILGIRKRR